jgi:hypothetical protein
MAAASVEHVSVQHVKCAIPFISTSGLLARVDEIVDNLQTMKQLSIPDELSINVVSIIIGSYVSKLDFNDPTNQYPRNHECTAFTRNLLKNPGDQLSPSILEHVRQSKVSGININQYMFLIDPMYSNPENAVPHGLVSEYPSIMYNPIISENGVITHDDLLPFSIRYNSILETCIIPDNIDDEKVNTIIARFRSHAKDSILINLMDCTSYTLRKMWVQNDIPNVYLANPCCFAIDTNPMYKPVITYSCSVEQCGYRWINYNLDKDMAPVYQLISPHSYEFLIHNYKRIVLEKYFLPIFKILSLMRISLEYTLKSGYKFYFDKMSFREFIHLWSQHHENADFKELFISFMDGYYKWNYYNFISMLLAEYSDSDESSMQKILLRYLEIHLQQLKLFFPSETIPIYINNAKTLLPAIIDYLHVNDIN